MKPSFVITAFVLAFFFSGCRKFHQDKIVADAPPYTPTNLYPIERLPTYFNRVAVLPSFHADSSSPALNYSDSIVLKELSKIGIFEPVSVSSQFCLKNFGKKRLSSAESLPGSFFKVIEENFAANGVLFIELHSFNSYRPLSIGIRAKLVDIKSGEFMWAVDETIDGGDASVIVSAHAYERNNYVQSLSAKTSSSILKSPRLFSKFAMNTIFSTLPNR